MEDTLYDIEAMRRFAKITLDTAPDESAIWHFRHFLETHKLTKTLFQSTQQYLSKHGMILSEGTILNASIASVPNGTYLGVSN